MLNLLKMPYLWLLEVRLMHYVGRWNHYRNRVLDEQAASVNNKIKIAKKVLNGPPLELSRRHYEYARLKNRGEEPKP